MYIMYVGNMLMKNVFALVDVLEHADNMVAVAWFGHQKLHYKNFLSFVQP